MIEPQWKSKQPVVYGVCWWNHKSIKGILENSRFTPQIAKSFPQALKDAHRKGGCIIGWASRITNKHEAACQSANVPLLRVEDGFLRSVGLGAGLAPAASLVIDQRGIYYDANRASDLEWLLEHAELDDEQRACGENLRKKIIESRISKYNFGQSLKDIDLPDNREKLLVPGQVGDDAAIVNTLSSSVNIKGVENINVELLKTVRKNNPNAYIIYKPHPDVVTNLRNGRMAVETALCYADQIVSSVDIIDLIDACDRVETLSSLSGFESLLRGKDVTVHGLPFYAGWGLTTDTTSCARRTKKRSIDELVYLSLVAYSNYVDPVTFQPSTAAAVIDSLSALKKSRMRKITSTTRLYAARIGEMLRVRTH